MRTASVVRGVQDAEEEHEEVHAVPAAQDPGGPPQEVLRLGADAAEDELGGELPAVGAEPVPLHGQRDQQLLQLLRHQQPQRHPLQRTLHRIRQASAVRPVAPLQ